MTLPSTEVDRLASILTRARVDGVETEAITASGELDVDEAYVIQRAVVEKQLAAGDRVIGAKLGLTSRAKQEQMGVEEPIFGVLTSSMRVDSGSAFELDTLIHPRCEPEIVFVIGEDLGGSDVTGPDVLDATKSVHGGIEVIDSRYRAFSFTLPDVIADNTSAARFVVGEEGSAPRDFDLTVMGCTFLHNLHVSGTATGAALLGDPAECVALLVRHLAATDRSLPAGSVVLAGSLTSAVPAARGDIFTARYGGLGDVEVSAR